MKTNGGSRKIRLVFPHSFRRPLKIRVEPESPRSADRIAPPFPAGALLPTTRRLAPATAVSPSGLEIAQQIKELVRLAQEQGYLTYSDINDALPDGLIGPEELDEIYL